MSFTYVIPDIHGRDDLLGRAIVDITAHRDGDDGVIVMIGDYVDKGPHSRQVVERLVGHCRLELVALKGNHDAMMVAGCAILQNALHGSRKAATPRSRPMAAILPPFRKPTSHGSTNGR